MNFLIIIPFYLKKRRKLTELKKGFFSKNPSMMRFTNKNELAIKSSYELAHLLAKSMKPFTDAEIIKNCIGTTVLILFFGIFPILKKYMIKFLLRSYLTLHVFKYLIYKSTN